LTTSVSALSRVNSKIETLEIKDPIKPNDCPRVNQSSNKSKSIEIQTSIHLLGSDDKPCKTMGQKPTIDLRGVNGSLSVKVRWYVLGGLWYR
jgi:hypothetical protein